MVSTNTGQSRGSGRGQGRGRGRGRGRRGRGQWMPRGGADQQAVKEELDAQLDHYMTSN